MSRIQLPENIDSDLYKAFETFWSTRSKQIEKQLLSDVHDQGNRSAVTGGKQLDGFVELVRSILISHGVSEKSIFTDSDLELPGYFRPNKKWDLLVVEDGRLLAAIEFKSQVGPSFGNNFNNRTEEAMGSALDIWTAYRYGAFGLQGAPWLGYFMVLEDSPKSSQPVKNRSPHFEVFGEFQNTSYKERYELFCKKLVLERQYNSACFMTTKLSQNGVDFDTPNGDLSFRYFISSLLKHIL